MNLSDDSQSGKNLKLKQTGTEPRSTMGAEDKLSPKATQAKIDQKVQEIYPEREIEKADFLTTKISSLAASILPHLLNFKQLERPAGGTTVGASDREGGIDENMIEQSASIAVSLYLAGEKQLRIRRLNLKKERDQYRFVLEMIEDGAQANSQGNGVLLDDVLKRLNKRQKPGSAHVMRRRSWFLDMLHTAQLNNALTPIYPILKLEKEEERNFAVVFQRLLREGVASEVYEILEVLDKEYGDARTLRGKKPYAKYIPIKSA